MELHKYVQHCMLVKHLSILSPSLSPSPFVVFAVKIFAVFTFYLKMKKDVITSIIFSIEVRWNVQLKWNQH